MRQKPTFKVLLAGLSLILMALPLIAAMSSFLTDFLNHANWYQPIQDYVVPFEAKLVAAAVNPLGIKTRVSPSQSSAAFYMIKGESVVPVDLAWNCLGWQSMLLLVVSLVAGLRGKFTNISRLECVVFGFFGTLLVNVFRMSLIAAGIYYINTFFALIVHDYLVALMTIAWLFFFWWFSYSFVLEEKKDVRSKESRQGLSLAP